MENNKLVDENKINKHYSDLLKDYVDSANASGEDVKEIAHKSPAFNKIMEAFEVISSYIENGDGNIMNDETEHEECNCEKDLIDELNKIFTPVLVMQNYEKEISDKTQSEMESAKVLNERTIIKFDDESRMSQLIAVCAKLIAKQKNTKAWQMFKQAADLKKKAGLELQKEEYEEAKELAQKYLIDVSSTNPSSVARQAALELLPQTRH